MDILSIIGLVMSFGAILGGNLMEGGHLGSLYNGPAGVIVLGGTIGAALIQTPLPIFKEALFMVRWVIFPPDMDKKVSVDKIIDWSQIARREGLLGLETIAGSETDPFARKGLELLIDGNEPEAIRSVLETDLFLNEHKSFEAVKVFDSMGGYAPTIGIIGAVMGLIHVMGNLGDPAKLGSGIATAFVATIYGVGFANILLLPVANKLKSRVHTLTQARELMIDGIIAISEGENPRTIEIKLNGYMESSPPISALDLDDDF